MVKEEQKSYWKLNRKYFVNLYLLETVQDVLYISRLLEISHGMFTKVISLPKSAFNRKENECHITSSGLILQRRIVKLYDAGFGTRRQRNCATLRTFEAFVSRSTIFVLKRKESSEWIKINLTFF